VADQDQPPNDGFPDEVVLPLEDSIDLHPFRPRDVKSVVESYLEAALEAGFEEVRVIHGKGIGVQRETVHAVLRKHPAVLSFGLAPGERGSWGATVVRLSPPGRARKRDE
jgi:dsDNA-specific endonuclease/ATPase MutS2